MRTSVELEIKLAELERKGVLAIRTENNPHLRLSYKGTDGLISSKWNVKIYSSGKIVCGDGSVLQDILLNRMKAPDPSKKVIRIDDAGIGLPVCGCMVGVECDGRIETRVVDVSFFQSPAYEDKVYLREYARLGWGIVKDMFGAKPETHRIEICTGAINRGLKQMLRERRFDVRAVEIKGLLQDSLEEIFRVYVQKVTGVDLAFDPKLLDNRGIAKRYYEAVDWARKNMPHVLKSGWKSLQ